MSEATDNPTTEDKPAATVAVKTEPEDEVVKKEEDSAPAVKEEVSDKAEAKPEAATEAAETPAPAPAGTAAPEEKAAESKLLKDLDDEAPKTFPQVLMEILANDEDADTISWLPHGRSFIIYKKKKFAAQVLPKYFKATKFTSFTRKLNRWGFIRVTRGPEMGSYYHKLFLREEPSLCLRMSSHSSSKFQEQQQLLPAPMAPAGMPFGAMPFGMPGMPMPGMNPMMPGAMHGMNPADLSQQNQLINQQLQQLQWQQFQLQQLQQQQQQQQQHGPPGMPPGQPPHHQGPPHMHQPPPPPPHLQHPGHQQPQMRPPEMMGNAPPPAANQAGQ